jgi:hypothetical protein
VLTDAGANALCHIPGGVAAGIRQDTPRATPGACWRETTGLPASGYWRPSASAAQPKFITL